MDTEDKILTRGIIKWSTLLLFTVITIVCLSMWGCPTYRVYKAGMEGKAELEQAKQNRQIEIEEAMAENEASISRAEAQVTMATAENQSMIIKAQGRRQADSITAIGVARANEIIGQSLKGNEDYLHYLWIDQLSSGNQKVYIPTEANLPILEAK